MKKIVIIILGILIIRSGWSQTIVECGFDEYLRTDMPISVDAGTYSVWSSIYTSSELGNQGGVLTSMAFKVEYVENLNIGNIKVYVKSTNETSNNTSICDLQAEAKYSYIFNEYDNNEVPFDQFDVYYLVYSGPFVGNGGFEWQEIVFNRGLDVPGGSNIEVVIVKENQGTGNIPLFYSYYSPEENSLMYISDYQNCDYNAQDNYKPFIQFTFNGVVNTRSFSTNTLTNGDVVFPSENTIYNVNSGTIATFYDVGGSGSNYNANMNTIVSFRPVTAGDIVTITINSFSSEIGPFGDFMIIYEGEEVDPSSQLVVIEGLNQSQAIYSSQYGITVLFNSDGLSEAAGWEIEVDVNPAPEPPPLQYSVLSKNINSGFCCLNSGSLKFQYIAEYKPFDGQKLTYTVYNEKNEELLLSTDSIAPNLTINYGSNFFTLDLSNVKSPLTELNVLVVENEKGEKMYLRFSNTNCIY